MSWWEIFKAGWHVDRKGRGKNWTVQELDKVVEQYDPLNYHEAPIVIDHNEESGPVVGGPAYGWVEALKRSGDRLLAKFKQVVPEFQDLVNKGMFKKRSIKIRPDGTLLHVSFLGAAPPAVKGLKDRSFSESDEDCFCYSESIPPIKEEESMELEELKRQNAELLKRNASLEADNAKKDGVIQQSAHEFSEFKARSRRSELEREFDAAVKDKRALPAWKDAGILEFMEELDDADQSFEFSEGKKETQLGWFRKFLAGLGGHRLFDEFATKNKKKPDDAAEFSEADPLLQIAVKAGKGGKE